MNLKFSRQNFDSSIKNSDAALPCVKTFFPESRNCGWKTASRFKGTRVGLEGMLRQKGVGSAELFVPFTAFVCVK